MYRSRVAIPRAARPVAIEEKLWGVCEFRSACGGSRARAYGVTGDYLAADPSCVYVPAAVGERPTESSPGA